MPPDISAAIGRTQYVQAVNASFAVFDKQTGAKLLGSATLKSLFSGFGGPCEQHNDGDPIIEYDRMADRWIITQFQVSAGNSQCVAVSTTGDATGRYHRYEFKYDKMNDYPKLGVWPDAYYITFNMFRPASGARACAYEREKMLQGLAARQVCFQLSTSFWSLLPADLEGAALPPTGSPNPMLSLGLNSQSLDLWQFHVDWANPSASTFGVGAQHTPNRSITVAPFNDACGGGSCIPQKNITDKLDSIGERLMMQASYRRFPNHDSLVVNHSVSAPRRGPGDGGTDTMGQFTLVYSANVNGNRDIYSITFPAGQVKQLTTHSASDASPAPSPDGKQIAFVSERDGRPEIYVMNADGTGQRRLTTNSVREEELAWLSMSGRMPMNGAAGAADVPLAPAPVEDRDGPPVVWGGSGAMLMRNEQGAATLDLGCDRGELSTPPPPSGEFDIGGIYEMRPGGPTPVEGGTVRRVPARFVGRVEGDRITLRVVMPETNQTAGPFTLERGGKRAWCGARRRRRDEKLTTSHRTITRNLY